MLSQTANSNHTRFNLSTLGGAAIAMAGVLGFVGFGGAQALGAHPFWGMKIAYFAIGAGLVMSVMAALAKQRLTQQLITFTTLLVISIAITTYGKTQFAASYAEDDFAGKLWFFGWIAALAASFSIVTAITTSWLARNKAN